MLALAALIACPSAGAAAAGHEQLDPAHTRSCYPRLSHGKTDARQSCSPATDSPQTAEAGHFGGLAWPPAAV